MSKLTERIVVPHGIATAKHPKGAVQTFQQGQAIEAGYELVSWEPDLGIMELEEAGHRRPTDVPDVLEKVTKKPAPSAPATAKAPAEK